MKNFYRIIALSITAMMAAMMANADTEWHLAMDDVQSVPVSRLSCLVVVDNSNEIQALDNLGQAVLKGQNVTFRQEEAGGIASISNDAQILVANEQIKILTAGADASAEVYDVNGRLLASAVSHGGSIVIDIKHLPSGTYVLSTNDLKTKFVKN